MLNKNYNKYFNKHLIKRFANTYEFVIKILINLFCYYEKKFTYMSTGIAGKDLMKHYYHYYSIDSNVNIEDITDVDYSHANREFKSFNKKSIGNYHDLYFQSNTLLLENFKDLCLEYMELILFIFYLHRD